jgi:hypothetical protein
MAGHLADVAVHMKRRVGPRVQVQFEVGDRGPGPHGLEAVDDQLELASGAVDGVLAKLGDYAPLQGRRQGGANHRGHVQVAAPGQVVAERVGAAGVDADEIGAEQVLETLCDRRQVGNRWILRRPFGSDLTRVGRTATGGE